MYKLSDFEERMELMKNKLRSISLDIGIKTDIEHRKECETKINIFNDMIKTIPEEYYNKLNEEFNSIENVLEELYKKYSI